MGNVLFGSGHFANDFHGVWYGLTPSRNLVMYGLPFLVPFFRILVSKFHVVRIFTWGEIFGYQFGRSGTGFLNYTRHCVCDGVPGSVWLVAPLFLFSFIRWTPFFLPFLLVCSL